MMNKTKAVVVIAITLLVAVAVSGCYINMIKQEGVIAPSTDDLWWYDEGFEDAFERVVECYEAREGITERDAEWKELWDLECRLAPKSVIRAIIMGEYIAFPNAFCMKFVDFGGENNITFLDEEKKPLPCGRDVITGGCIDEVYDTTYRWINVDVPYQEYENIAVVVLQNDSLDIEIGGLGGSYIIYVVVDADALEPTTADGCFPDDGFCTNIEFERREIG